MPNDSLFDFYLAVHRRTENTEERLGQATFNHLWALRPELASAIQGTRLDPFYVDDVNEPRWSEFITWLEANWRKT